MDVFQLCALVIGGLVLVVLLRQYHPVYALVVSLVLSVLLLVQALQMLTEVQNTLTRLFSWVINDYYSVILRIVGIGLIVQATAELCREAGQNALEGKIILLGKLLILVAALPLIGRVLEMLSGLLL